MMFFLARFTSINFLFTSILHLLLVMPLLLVALCKYCDLKYDKFDNISV